MPDETALEEHLRLVRSPRQSNAPEVQSPRGPYAWIDDLPSPRAERVPMWLASMPWLAMVALVMGVYSGFESASTGGGGSPADDETYLRGGSPMQRALWSS